MTRDIVAEKINCVIVLSKQESTEVGGHRIRLKNESQWIQIPDHNPAIASMKLFERVQAQRTRFKHPKKITKTYPLRDKVFCGCCEHVMPRTFDIVHDL